MNATHLAADRRRPGMADCLEPSDVGPGTTPVVASVPQKGSQNDLAPARASWRDGLPVLRGDGLCAREPQKTDAAGLTSLLTPRTIWPFRAKAPVSASGWARLLDRSQSDRATGLSALFLVESERSSGVLGLVLIRRLELDFRIAEAQFLFGEEAWESDAPQTGLSFALDFAFRDIGVHRLEARTLTGREGVVLRSLGLVQEGLLRDAYPLWGGLATQTIWAMLRTEWLSRQVPPPRRQPARPSAPEPVRQMPDAHEPDDELPGWTRAVPVLRGARVVLREMEPADGDALVRVLDPSDIALRIEPAPTTPEMFRQYVAWARRQRQAGRAVSLAILLDGYPEPIGMMQVRSKDDRFRIGEWGIVLTRDQRGTGVLDEALALVGGFLFDTIGIRRLEARTSGTNLPAIGAMKRYGFVREAELRGSFLVDGEYRDDELWRYSVGDRR